MSTKQVVIYVHYQDVASLRRLFTLGTGHAMCIDYGISHEPIAPFTRELRCVTHRSVRVTLAEDGDVVGRMQAASIYGVIIDGDAATAVSPTGSATIHKSFASFDGIRDRNAESRVKAFDERVYQMARVTRSPRNPVSVPRVSKVQADSISPKDRASERLRNSWYVRNYITNAVSERALELLDAGSFDNTIHIDPVALTLCLVIRDGKALVDGLGVCTFIGEAWGISQVCQEFPLVEVVDAEGVSHVVDPTSLTRCPDQEPAQGAQQYRVMWRCCGELMAVAASGAAAIEATQAQASDVIPTGTWSYSAVPVDYSGEDDAE